MRAFRLADDLPARHPPQVDRVASSAVSHKEPRAQPRCLCGERQNMLGVSIGTNSLTS